MAIKAGNGPANGDERVGNFFSAVTEGPANPFKTEAGGAPAARLRKPVPIFALDMEMLRDTGPGALDQARRTGWRYLVDHPAGLDVIDLPEEPDGRPRMLVSSEIGGRLARSGNKAEKIAADNGEYEPRILDLNLIGNSVLWLHKPNEPDGDRFISLSGTPRELKSDALFRRLSVAAGRKLNAMKGTGKEAGG